MQSLPNERKGQYYEEYAADAGGWEELMCLASPREQARYKTAVISQLAKDQAAWDKEMSAQFNELSLACSHDALTTLMGESVDGNVMKAIAQFKQMYGTETEGRRFTLLKKFLKLRMLTKDLEAHITRTKDLISDLGKLQPPEKFTEGTSVMVFLESIEPKLPGVQGIVTAAKRGQDKAITLSDAFNMARDFASSKKTNCDSSSEESDSSSDDESAKLTSTGYKFKGVCHHCKKPGHKKFFCPERKKEWQKKKAANASKSKARSVKSKAKKAKGTKHGKVRSRSVFTHQAMAAVVKKKNTRKPTKKQKYTLLLDTEASANFMNTKALMSDTKPTNTKVTLADGAPTAMAEKGNLSAMFSFKGENQPSECKSKGKTYYVPEFVASLLSGSVLVDNGHDIHLSKKDSYIALGGSKHQRIPIKVTEAGFEVEVQAVPNKKRKVAFSSKEDSEIEESESESEEEEEEEDEEDEEEEEEDDSE